jgi:phosphoglycolate phosphatase-like HAD superfamily hydrolase
MNSGNHRSPGFPRADSVSPALVVFDVDGTLLDTERVTVPAVQETFAAFCLPKPDARTICSFFGLPVEEYEAWLARMCPTERAAEIVEATNARELRCIGESGRLYPGVRAALAELKADGHRLAVCSNGPDAYIKEFLDAHEMRGFFDMVCTRGTRYSGKAAILEEILSRIPARPVIVVGDRHDDIESAHDHGAWAIAADYGFGSPQELADADLHVPCAADIPAAVRTLLARSVRSKGH